MRYLILILTLVVLQSCSVVRVTTVMTHDAAPGAAVEHQTYGVEASTVVYARKLSKRISGTVEPYAGVYVSQGEVMPGLGGKAVLNYAIGEWTFFTEGGIIGIYNGGNMNGLADDEWFFQTIGAGVQWRWLRLGVWHRSSYRHHADDGDSGQNGPFIGGHIKF